MREPRPIRLHHKRIAALLGIVLTALVVLFIVLGSHDSGSSGASVARSSAQAHRRRLSTGIPRRHDVPLLALPVNPLPINPSGRTIRVPILTWHRVAVFAREYTKSVPDETVEPGVFAQEIDALASHGYHPISQLQLFNALFHGASLPPKPVLLTVDDGYVDDVKTILPILKAHRFVATFYIITHRFHEPGFLNATEVRRLDAAGMDIGAHTRNHVALANASTTEMTEQIAGSRRDLERILSHPVQWFAYPFGSFDDAVVAAVRKAGFVLAVTTKGGTSEISTAPLTMPRIHIGRSAGVGSVLACASSGACGGGGG